MKKLCLAALIAAVFASCSQNENQLRPGEKYTIDTIMYREYRKIDSMVKSECDKVSDGIFRKAYDSLLRIRVRDISSIKGDGRPPVENKFPEAVRKVDKKEEIRK